MIHNISIATDDDTIHIDDDVNIYTPYIYPVQLSFRGNYLNWLEKTLFQIIFLSVSCKLIWELTNGH